MTIIIKIIASKAHKIIDSSKLTDIPVIIDKLAIRMVSNNLQLNVNI